MQTRHIVVFVSSLCVTRLWPCELWHLAFSKIIFRKMPFFPCFWQKINAFMPWAVLSVQKKKGCSLDLTFARMARFSTKAFLSQKSELETRKMVFHEMYHVWKKEKKIILSTSVILTKSQCYKIMRMNYVETCKILQYTLTRNS